MARTAGSLRHCGSAAWRCQGVPPGIDHLFVRYSQQHVENPTVNSQALLYNSSGNNVFPLWNDVVGYTRTFGATLVNELSFGVNSFPAEANTQMAASSN